jgi:SAM-dependent methyltransferase
MISSALLKSILPSRPERLRPPYDSRAFARRFDRLRRFQDREAIVRNLRQIHPLENSRVLELGAGTGFLTEALAVEAKSVFACDRSPAMLKETRHNLERHGFYNVSLVAADHRRLPFENGSFDLVVSAFAFDSLAYDAEECQWRKELDLAIGEMLRVTAPGGKVVFIGAPQGRRNIGQHLESAWGFERRIFLTRWKFPGRRLARAAICLFFSDRVWRDFRPHWPKALVTFCGLWWKKKF